MMMTMILQCPSTAMPVLRSTLGKQFWIMVRQPGGMDSPGNTSELHAIPEVTPFSSSSSSSAFATTLTFGRRIVARCRLLVLAIFGHNKSLVF